MSLPHFNQVILGGGYAGLAALLSIRSKSPQSSICLIDSRSHHIKLTSLHKSIYLPIEYLSIPFSQLAIKYNFTFRQETISFKLEDILQWQRTKTINNQIKFDQLIIATGATQNSIDLFNKNDSIYTLDRIIQEGIYNKLTNSRHISFLGAGPTGVQFLFEIYDYFKRHKLKCKFNLIFRGNDILENFPTRFQTTVQSRLAEKNIQVYSNATLKSYESKTLKIESNLPQQSTQSFEIATDCLFAFTGVKPNPEQFKANLYGQIIISGKVLENIFTAGDVSVFEGKGLNKATAQAAVRKAKLIAENCLLQKQSNKLKPYTHKELGFFISLGSFDGIGWILSQANVVSGLPALTIKEVIEKQFELFLQNIDTYIV